MNNNIKRWLVTSVCCFMLGSGQSIMAQQVIFPQEVQANKAQLESNTNKPKSVIRISLCRTAKRNPLIFPI